MNLSAHEFCRKSSAVNMVIVVNFFMFPNNSRSQIHLGLAASPLIFRIRICSRQSPTLMVLVFRTTFSLEGPTIWGPNRVHIRRNVHMLPVFDVVVHLEVEEMMVNHKAFENKWTRSTSTNSSSSRQSDNQPVAPNHTCTDSDSCRRQIMEDFNNEKPMWLLTCYGHRKNGPCDVTGDVSYEELRAAAYDDAKRGQSLMSIVERERNMLNSKAAEFENLLRNYVPPSTSVPNAQSPFPGAASNASLGAQSPFPGTAPNAALSAQSPFPGTAPNASLSTQSPFPGAAPNASLRAQSSFPPSASSFSQLGALLNTGASAPPTNTFGQPSPLGNSVKTSSSSGANAFSFGNAGSGSFGFGSQVTSQSHQNPFTPSNISASSERNPFSTSQHFPNSSGSQLPTPQRHFSASVAVSPFNINLTNAASTEEFSGDNSIWTKKEWKIGEIPEAAPPDKYIF